MKMFIAGAALIGFSLYMSTITGETPEGSAAEAIFFYTSLASWFGGVVVLGFAFMKEFEE